MAGLISAVKGQQQVAPVTIPSGQSLSSAINLEVWRACALATPAVLDGTTLSFAGSVDGGTYLPVYDAAGNEKTLTVSASAARLVVLAPADFFGLRYLKLRQGTAAAPQAAAADRVFSLIAEG